MDWMKPIERTDIPTGDEWLYEVKYDGFRCKLIWENENIRLVSKNDRDMSKQFPEIIDWCKANHTYVSNKLPLVVDGELVILNHTYQANFAQIQVRGRMRNTDRIVKQAKQRPATFMVFDLLEINGDDVRQDTLSLRKEMLQQLLQLIPDHTFLSYVATFTSMTEVQKVVFASQSEGTIAKRKKSMYQRGKDHHDWFKIKNWREIQGIVTAYNPSNDYFTVKVRDNDQFIDIGTCKRGPEDSIRMVQAFFKEKGELENGIYQLPPAITGNIHTLDLYGGELREPHFKQIDPSVSNEDCTWNKLRLDMAQLPASIDITNVEKDLWPNHYTKTDLLVYLREVSPWLLPFLSDRALTIIRCPNGVDQESFFQKNPPDYAPDDLSANGTDMVCHHLEELIWLANHGAIEYHIPFQKVGKESPVEIAFDLDPPSRNHFQMAVKAANIIKSLLDDLELVSFVKTSGNKGLQVYIPIEEGSMTYDEAGLLTMSIAKTMEEAYPDSFTTERIKKKRKNCLYIDYVQHGKDKTLIAPYSPRMTKEATVSTPLYWHEVNADLDPTLFRIGNVLERVREGGCPFSNYHKIRKQQRMEKMLRFIRG
ncbi:DNA ligase D [Gracilibacillus phocaeensis]|uniref:DNA ligase D n=1 Tax=Gracilibacillus phocaeensis TaxID=2042304 RepID=UPI00103195AB|nr:DNA ligase D [Gracilibacillus phocaeensis]